LRKPARHVLSAATAAGTRTETKPTPITARHVLASGSLPPQFPWTQIGDSAKPHYYWDGGIVDNTPLGDAIDAFTPGSDIERVLVVMNLFPTAARLPPSFADVNDRVTQLRFGSRMHQDSENAERISGLVSTIDELATLAERSPGGIPADLQPAVAAARSLKTVETFEITLSADSAYSDPNGFRDFSHAGMKKRRDVGRTIALSQLSPFFIGQRAA
jgi:NTE family protein